MDAETIALRVWVSGRVQGVFFRESTRRMADELRLRGWVRNVADGRVEAYFVGAPAACEAALAFVRTGPPAADVSGIDFYWEPAPQVPPPGFGVR